MPHATRRRPRAEDPALDQLLDEIEADAAIADEDVPAVDAPAETAPPVPMRFGEGELQYVAYPGYPGLRVGFSIAQALYIMSTPMPSTQAIRKDPQKFFRWLRIFVRRFEGWTFVEDDDTPVPAPTPSDLESYFPLLRDQALLIWLAGEGFYAALTGGTLPNSAGASSPTSTD